jgi:hypothetical protein
MTATKQKRAVLCVLLTATATTISRRHPNTSTTATITLSSRLMIAITTMTSADGVILGTLGGNPCFAPNGRF